MITIDRNCRGCGLCEKLCPAGAVRVLEGRASLDAGACIACQQCACVCPAGAVRTDAREIIPEGLSPLQRLVFTRRSCRYYADEALPEGLTAVLRAAVRSCPTALNQASVRLVVIEDRSLLRELDRRISRLLCRLIAFVTLPGINLAAGLLLKDKYPRIANYWDRLSTPGRILFDAPALGIIACRKGSVMGGWDASAAAQTCVLLLEEASLASCYAGLAQTALRHPGLKRLAGLDRGEYAACCFVFGKPA
ncbi:MAG: nitroreductase family protein, partial [Abditibacteriota bacterium]|nr:nitroreductase family protein [Abditibacteriota bacterium]